MSATNHPCDRYSCTDNVGGQCFGGGCMANPIRRDEREEEDEINDEWYGEEES